MMRADILTRSDVVVSRDGWVTDPRHGGSIVGHVSRDVNAVGTPIWRAYAGDVGHFAFKRADAVQTVLDLRNMQEKARAYDLLTRKVSA